MTDDRFVVVDLGTQISEERRFAVWDHTVSKFWKINGHHTWSRLDELTADFEKRWPDNVRFHEVHRKQHDRIAEQAFALGFPTSESEP
jgi:hypothetical protein